MTQRAEFLPARAARFIELAEDKAHGRANLCKHARTGDRGADLRRTAQHVRFAQDRDEAFGRVDTVLQRDHGGVRANDGFDVLCARFEIPQLHAGQDNVGGGQFARAVSRLNREQVGLAARALNAQARGFHSREMCAARHKNHLRTRLGESDAKHTAHSAGADNNDPHL